MNNLLTMYWICFYILFYFSSTKIFPFNRILFMYIKLYVILQNYIWSWVDLTHVLMYGPIWRCMTPFAHPCEINILNFKIFFCILFSIVTFFPFWYFSFFNFICKYTPSTSKWLVSPITWRNAHADNLIQEWLHIIIHKLGVKCDR